MGSPSCLDGSMQAARSFAAWYDAHLTTSPIVTKSVTSCGLFGVGDGLAQGIEGGEGVDASRLARRPRPREASERSSR